MALTLVEASKRNSGNVLRSAVIETYARSSDILRVLPFETINGGGVRYDQEHTLPGIGFRNVNGSYPESTGTVNPQFDPTVIAGGDLDVDKYIIATRGANTRTTQEEMKVKALAHRWSLAFVKGDSTTGSGEFDGIQIRLRGTQVIDNGATSNGDALSIAKLDQLIDAVDNPTHLFMTKAMRRILTAAARNPAVGGYITYARDEFGRQVTLYNDLPLLIADQNGDAYASIGFNETNPGGGTTTGSSVYCLSIGPGMIEGIQNSDPMVVNLGELETKPALRTRVEWYAGIACYHPRAGGRLRGIKDAAAVA